LSQAILKKKNKHNVISVTTKVQQVSSRSVMAVVTLFVMIAESVEKIALCAEARRVAPTPPPGSQTMFTPTKMQQCPPKMQQCPPKTQQEIYARWAAVNLIRKTINVRDAIVTHVVATACMDLYVVSVIQIPRPRPRRLRVMALQRRRVLLLSMPPKMQQCPPKMQQQHQQTRQSGFRFRGTRFILLEPAVVVAQRMFFSNVRHVPQQHVQIAMHGMWSFFALMRWITAYNVQAIQQPRSRRVLTRTKPPKMHSPKMQQQSPTHQQQQQSQ
jgi:hypothetical protein